jgi:hypothetical protein
METVTPQIMFGLLMPSYLLQDARDTVVLQAAKSMLAEKVEELTWRLDLEKRMRVR